MPEQSPQAGATIPILTAPHTLPADKLVAALDSTANGLSHAKAADRLQRFGRNTLPSAEPPGIVMVFLHQFTSPLIYILVAAALFQTLLASGYTLDEARNATLMLMVLFENIHVFNSRSETLSTFRHNPLHNPLLLFGTLAAQLIHIAAMYIPWISDVLHIQPISPQHWLELLGFALSVLVVMELRTAVRHWLVSHQSSANVMPRLPGQLLAATHARNY